VVLTPLSRRWNVSNTYCPIVPYKTRELVPDIKINNLERFEWVDGMDQTRVAKNIFFNNPKRRREVTKPRLAWLEDVENDLRQLKVNMLRQK
jgi:hypothetical protein